MPRHSKNNTASSVFTYHETHSLEYGTKKQRLGRDSFRNFDACHLCLQKARDPVCCPQGHLSCRECALENILAQKKGIQRQSKLLDLKQAEEDEERRRKEEAAKEAIITDFERAQTKLLPEALRKAALGLSSSSSTSTSTSASSGKSKGLVTPSSSSAATRSPESVRSNVDATPSSSGTGGNSTLLIAGQKRKFEFSKEEVQAIAEREKEEAMRKLEEARTEGAKAKLPAFWLPSLTPSADNPAVTSKSSKTHTICTATKEEHPVSIKTLIPAKFTKESAGAVSSETLDAMSYVCPACMKTITNSLRISIMKNCGHVICHSCVDKFVKQSKQCYVCEVKTKERDIIDMSGEGTGFTSGGGTVLARRFDIAFQ